MRTGQIRKSVSYWWLAAVVACSLLLALPILLRGIPQGPDLQSHLRYVIPFYSSLSQGNFLPGWQSVANSGYGDASFRIYTPGIYYVLSALQAVCSNWFTALSLFLVFLTTSSGLGIYVWIRSAGFSAAQATAAAAIYVASPFHVNELYQSSLLAQYAAGGLLALIFASLEKVQSEGDSSARLRAIVLLGLLLALLVYTHIGLTLMAVVVLPIYIVVRTERSKLRRVVLDAACGAVLGAMLSAPYWTTLVAEIGWVKGDSIQPGTRYNYASNFLFTAFSAERMDIWYPSLLALALIALCAGCWLILRHVNESSHTRRWILTASVIAFFSFLMATPLSSPLWIVIPKLKSLEFPWRWLSVTSITASGLAGIALPGLLSKLRDKHREAIGLVSLGLLIIGLSVTVAYPLRNVIYISRSEFSSIVKEIPSQPGLEEWLPAQADHHLSVRSDGLKATAADGRAVTALDWQPEFRRISVAAGPPTELKIHSFYYPLWTATTAAGVPLQTRSDVNGLLNISLPGGHAEEILIHFARPFREQLSRGFSILGLVLAAALFLYSKRLGEPSSFSRQLSAIPANVD
jgi:hypothetical protein